MRHSTPLRAALLALALPAGARAGGGGRPLFIPSAHENGDNTVTLPLHHGTSQGRDVWFVVLDASTSNGAQAWGANRSNKLANAAGTTAVQRVTVGAGGTIDFPQSVDFTPDRVVDAPHGFPPDRFAPGAVGEPVKYVSTDATDPLAAALEDATLAPALNAAPFAGGDGTDSARATLVAFVNGATGAGNPQRQGLNSAAVHGLDPLKVLAGAPDQGRHNPLWDVHLTAFAPGVTPTRQTEVAKVEDLARAGLVTAPDGSAFGASGIIVDCPIVSQG